MTKSVFAPDLLAGKRILITGGGTGLGRGVARHLTDHGAQVHLWGRREAVLAEAAASAGAAGFQTVDVRKADLVDAAMASLWEEHGPLTGVQNNAAANFIAPTASADSAAMATSAARPITARPSPARPNSASAPTATLVNLTSAARMPSMVR